MLTFAFEMKEQVVPYVASSLSKKKQVEQMFDRIAFRYDLMNHLLSFGIDVSWRKKIVKSLRLLQPKTILDVATGTADVALLLSNLQAEKIIGIDISDEMLEIGRKKIAEKNLSNKITLQNADSENLPFEGNNFEAVTVAFGVRNFEHLEKGIQEIYRVLKPGGTFVVLEFSKPKHFPFKQLYQFYFTTVCPLLGKWITRDKQAYQYLYRSVQVFPEGQKFLNILERMGFEQLQCKSLSFGISSLYTARKP
ncbi:MAG TPA: bifunctional demethylmenaquinone methyltransferase/2-methoxy-6-polyprenyl-1,4-benzoquinol methylase UbiE [Chitinophagales bacterium]|nr:bifunctional demethylmenaquinone methyltransferase/2-methoxy-6-polyprenyl-1,4-benzoquinol methylase UbiE [Chitinophagales bacterium]